MTGREIKVNITGDATELVRETERVKKALRGKRRPREVILFVLVVALVAWGLYDDGATYTSGLVGGLLLASSIGTLFR